MRACCNKAKYSHHKLNSHTHTHVINSLVLECGIFRVRCAHTYLQYSIEKYMTHILLDYFISCIEKPYEFRDVLDIVKTHKRIDNTYYCYVWLNLNTEKKIGQKSEKDPVNPWMFQCKKKLIAYAAVGAFVPNKMKSPRFAASWIIHFNDLRCSVFCVFVFFTFSIVSPVHLFFLDNFFQSIWQWESSWSNDEKNGSTAMNDHIHMNVQTNVNWTWMKTSN